MQKTKIVGFDAKAFGAQIMANIIAEQNARLVDYAKTTIGEIGEKIKTYHSRNGMDRTGNLLDSLCWCVSYKGKVVESGFYREKQSRGTSYLHEWFSGDVKYSEPIDGHALAAQYLAKHGASGSTGWRIFFAILAPYWGYWENGFTLKSNFGKTSRFMQFAVMAEFYDQVRRDLKPARRYRFNSPVVTYEREKLEKKWDRYAGIS